MAVNETIVTGRKFRKLIDAATRQWQRISFWHKASDCEFDDGKTAEEKLGAINGITDALNTNRSDITLSAKAGKSLQDQFTQLSTNTNNQITQISNSVNNVSNRLGSLTFTVCTKAQYEASAKSSNTLYIIVG